MPLTARQGGLIVSVLEGKWRGVGGSEPPASCTFYSQLYIISCLPQKFPPPMYFYCKILCHVVIPVSFSSSSCHGNLRSSILPSLLPLLVPLPSPFSTKLPPPPPDCAPPLEHWALEWVIWVQALTRFSHQIFFSYILGCALHGILFPYAQSYLVLSFISIIEFYIRIIFFFNYENNKVDRHNTLKCLKSKQGTMVGFGTVLEF